MIKPKYLLLSERMGNGETLEELVDKAREIIDKGINAEELMQSPIELDKVNNPLLYGRDDFIPWH